MAGIPPLKGARVTLRALTENDFDVLHEVHARGFGDGTAYKSPEMLAKSRKALDWILLNEWFPRLRHWNTRLIELNDTKIAIGEVALVPMPMPLEAIISGSSEPSEQSVEVSMLWGVLPEYRGKGFATEAASLLIDYAFGLFNLGRIVADTEFSNKASQVVMRRLGMTLYENHDSARAREWFEVIGVLSNPAVRS